MAQAVDLHQENVFIYGEGASESLNLRFPGQYFDKESGLNYNYFRSYDAKTGRYTQSDPIGLDGGWNRFSYVNQNPLKFTDPRGLEGFDLTDASPVPGGDYQQPNPLDNTLTPSPQAICIAKCMAGKAATGAGIALSAYGLLELGARTGYLSPLAAVGLVSTYRQYGRYYTTGRQALNLEQCKSECDDNQCKK
jgi:RHS repeat-associated protein